MSDDAITLTLNGVDQHAIYQSYNVAASVFEQPSVFNMTLGTGESVASIRKRYARNDEFNLRIGDIQLMTGYVDGLSFNGDAAVCTFRGRNRLRRLTDGYPLVEMSFSRETYFELTEKILELSGMRDFKLFTDNKAARKKFTQIDAEATAEAWKAFEKDSDTFKSSPEEQRLALAFSAKARAQGSAAKIAEEIERAVESAALAGVDTAMYRLAPPGPNIVRESKKLRLGVSWWAFLQEQYKKAGLFLWSTGDGDFVLTEPDANQAPSYRIVRTKGQNRESTNVTSASLTDGSPGLHQEVICYGRSGDAKTGRVKCQGSHTLDKKIALLDAQGRPQVFEKLAFVDNTVTSDAEAEFAARRRSAEERRSSWKLEYTVEGHRVLGADQFSTSVWTPDTMVDVQDDWLGVYGPHYLHTVEYVRGSSGTHSTLMLMRPEDLVFSETMSQ